MKWRYFPLILGMVLLLLMGCKKEVDTCEEDKKNEDWSAVAENTDCTAGQRGEAYLALGGFDYFKVITAGEVDIVSLLGLTSANWKDKLAYFDSALDMTRPWREKGDDLEKTVYFFASFVALFTYLEGTLDNGSGGGTAMDGTISDGELAAFTGASLASSSGGDGTTLTATTYIQVKYEGAYYIWDSSTGKVYEDSLADGIANSELDATNTALVLAGSKSWTEVNQVVDMDSLTNPLNGSADVDAVTGFASQLLSYLDDFEQGLLALGVDATDDSIKDLADFKNQLDNGGSCSSLESNPNLRLVELFASNTREDQVTGSQTYATDNIFSQSDLSSLGEDTSFTSISSISVDPGVKMLFKTSSGGYVPYWSGADSGIKAAMESLAKIGAKVEAGDGVISFSELMCVGETTSE